MIGIDIGIGLVAVAALAAAYRIIAGPTDSDRAVGADLFFFAFLGLLTLIGVRAASTATFDLVLVATLVGFLSALSLARVLTRGRR